MKKKLFFVSAILIFFVSCADEIVTNTPTVFDDVPSTEMPASFSAIQETVFNNSCATSGCHSGSVLPNLSAGVAYSNIVNRTSFEVLDYIEPGEPDNSYLLRKIKGGGISGGRMPDGAPPLNQSVIDSIETWIANGALNN
ncbi:MAG: hypothetical protein KKA84_03150 [Bacteroidetes bacterium]|nr:hypothetical protein [Bacteroidota bacterium]